MNIDKQLPPVGPVPDPTPKPDPGDVGSDAPDLPMPPVIKDDEQGIGEPSYIENYAPSVKPTAPPPDCDAWDGNGECVVIVPSPSPTQLAESGGSTDTPFTGIVGAVFAIAVGLALIAQHLKGKSA